MFPRNPIYQALQQATGSGDGGAGAGAGAGAPAASAPAASQIVAPEPILGKEAPAAAAAPGAAAAVAAAGEKPAVDAAAAAQPTLADQKAYLLKQAGDDQTKKSQVEALNEADVAKKFTETKAAEAAAAKPLTADDYMKSLKLPEGFTLNKEAFGEFAKIASKAGMTQEQMQTYVENLAKSTMEVAQAPYKLWADTQAQWQKDLKEDKEIGGDKLDANLAIGEKFISTLPNAKEVRAALKFTGAGNNPQIVKAFIAAGRLVAEGKPVTGSPGGGAKKSAAATFYPSMASGEAGS